MGKVLSDSALRRVRKMRVSTSNVSCSGSTQRDLEISCLC